MKQRTERVKFYDLRPGDMYVAYQGSRGNIFSLVISHATSQAGPRVVVLKVENNCSRVLRLFADNCFYVDKLVM